MSNITKSIFLLIGLIIAAIVCYGFVSKTTIQLIDFSDNTLEKFSLYHKSPANNNIYYLKGDKLQFDELTKQSLVSDVVMLVVGKHQYKIIANTAILEQENIDAMATNILLHGDVNITYNTQDDSIELQSASFAYSPITSLLTAQDKITCKQQDLFIVADSAVFDMLKGQVHYKGNVKVTKLDYFLQADELIVDMDEQTKNIGVLHTIGRPLATIVNTKTKRIAQAQAIYYYAKNNTIDFIGNAKIIEKDKPGVVGAISYDLTTDKLIVQEYKSEKSWVQFSS